MRYQILKILFLLFLPLSSLGQLQDNFSDGDFTNNPAWSGDAGQFIVNTNQQLQLNATGAGTSYLSTSLNPPSSDTLEWEFFIRLSFSPSANNYARVYLSSDQQDLTGALNGYYLQFGESLSNDAVELFRQSGTSSTSVCRGTNAEIANSFSVKVKVIRDNFGQWTLFVDPGGGTNYSQEGTGADAVYGPANYSGIVCVNTSSNATNFYFDDLYAGSVHHDLHPEVKNSGDEITIDPEIFSPDDDGKDDVVNLVYHFQTSGYIANVRIFDSKGRPVRDLVSGESIGNDGKFIWDGINDKKERARIGIYIFYVEIFDMNGLLKDYKKTCVLASRLDY